MVLRLTEPRCKDGPRVCDPQQFRSTTSLSINPTYASLPHVLRLPAPRRSAGLRPAAASPSRSLSGKSRRLENRCELRLTEPRSWPPGIPARRVALLRRRGGGRARSISSRLGRAVPAVSCALFRDLSAAEPLERNVQLAKRRGLPVDRVELASRGKDRLHLPAHGADEHLFYKLSFRHSDRSKSNSGKRVRC